MISVSSSIGSATWVAGGDISGAVAWMAPGTVVSAHTNGTKSTPACEVFMWAKQGAYGLVHVPCLNVTVLAVASVTSSQGHFTAMPAQIVKLLYLTKVCDSKIIALRLALTKNRPPPRPR